MTNYTAITTIAVLGDYRATWTTDEVLFTMTSGGDISHVETIQAAIKCVRDLGYTLNKDVFLASNE